MLKEKSMRVERLPGGERLESGSRLPSSQELNLRRLCPAPPRPGSGPAPALAPPLQTARRRPASQWEARDFQSRLQITAGSVRRAAAPDKIDYFSPCCRPAWEPQKNRAWFFSPCPQARRNLGLMAPGAWEVCCLPLFHPLCRHG